MTAEEFLKDIQIEHSPVYEYETSWNMCLEAMIKFAQHHVKEALKAASEKSTLLENGIDTNNFRYFIEKYDSFYNDMEIDINKESILTAYPLEKIK